MLRISLRVCISFSAHFVQKTQNISFFYTYRCCEFFEADEGAGAGLDLLDPEVSFLTGFEDFPCGFEGWGAGMGCCSSFSLGISSSARGVDVFMGLPGSESSVYKWVVSESSLGYIGVGVSGLDSPEEDSTSLSWESISFSVGRINLFLDLGGCILKMKLDSFPSLNSDALGSKLLLLSAGGGCCFLFLFTKGSPGSLISGNSSEIFTLIIISQI